MARFGPYEVNVRSGEVKKFGTRIKVGEQPVRILILLMEREGELVTREELRSQLWSSNTFVDFDHSLNSAVQRLRDSLSDTAQKGRWIETVPRRGYRFVGTVEWSKQNGSGSSGAVLEASNVEHGIAPKKPELAGAARPVQGISWSFRWRLLVAIVALAIGAAVFTKVVVGRRNVKADTRIRSLAVLPLENLSGDPSQDYFADGMTDELITALAKNGSLHVISRTSAMQYKGVSRPVRDIARELGVEGILEGSVSRSANRVHMNVQLIHAPSDTHIWAESYDRDLNEAMALPSDLSQTIAKEVKVAISPPQPAHYVNPEAHDLYLRGRYFFFSDNDVPGLPYLQKAIEIQPDYAAAWSAISDYYGGRAVAGDDPPQQFRAIWEADARKAIALDDSLADGHNSLAAWHLFGEWNWQAAEPESERAIALNPNNVEAYHIYSYILTVMNRPAEAVEAQKRGMELDPYARSWALGLTYYHLRQFDAAINELRLREQGMRKDLGVHGVLADVYARVGLMKEAAEERVQMSLLQGDKQSAEAIRQAFVRGGYQAVAEWQLERDKASNRGQYISPFRHAVKTARAGQKEETLRSLEDAYREHSPRLVFLQHEPEFDFLRSEPRYQAIVQKMGLRTTSSSD